METRGDRNSSHRRRTVSMRRNRDDGAARWTPPDAVLPIAEYVYAEHFRGMNVRKEDVYATFAGTRDAGDRFMYVFGLLKRHGWLPQSVDGFVKLSPAHRRWRKRLKKRLHRSRVSVDMDCSTARKDGDASDAYRSRGNEAFKERADYAESLKFYTLSAMTAVAGSTGYALAVANRSAALYHLAEYEHCLRDVERALASGAYPPHNGHKLLERKGNCYRNLDHGSLALDAYSDCLSHLNATQLSLAEKEVIQARIRECINKCKETETESKTQKRNTKCIRLSEPKNNNSSVLSKFVKISYSEETGRGLFVSKDIMPGEILIMEKPFAGVYKNDMWIFNCDYCFKRCLSSIPCPKCSRVLYCDETCLQRACDSYHGVECSLVYPLKGDPTVEPVHDLALRCFIQLTNAMGIGRYCTAVRRHSACGDNYGNCGGNNNNRAGRHFQPYNDGGDGDSKDGNNDGGEASESDFDRAAGAGTAEAAAADFRAVYGLDGNESRRTVSNMFSMHCTASMMVSVLLLNGFRVPSDMMATIGESLVHLLCVANLNSHASAEPSRHVAEPPRPRSRGIVVDRGGVALVLCPAYSLINHSCDPNVSVQTHGGVEVTRAVQPIPSGSQLFTDYGVNFMSHDKDDRLAHLWDQYQFHCQCRACTQNWPTSQELDELYESKPSHLSTNSQIIGIPDTTLAKFNEIVHLLSTHQTINADCLDFLFSFLNLSYSCNINKPRSIYYKCVRVIQKCLYSTSDQMRCIIE